jgi:Ribonuclease G/E
MEITRKRVRPNVVKEHSNVCPTCKGDGYIPTKESVVGSIDRWLRRFRAKRGEKEIIMALHPEMISHVIVNRAIILKYWEISHKTKINLVEDESSNFAEFKIFSKATNEEISQGVVA